MIIILKGCRNFRYLASLADMCNWCSYIHVIKAGFLMALPECFLGCSVYCRAQNRAHYSIDNVIWAFNIRVK